MKSCESVCGTGFEWPVCPKPDPGVPRQEARLGGAVREGKVRDPSTIRWAMIDRHQARPCLRAGF